MALIEFDAESLLLEAMQQMEVATDANFAEQKSSQFRTYRPQRVPVTNVAASSSIRCARCSRANAIGDCGNTTPKNLRSPSNRRHLSPLRRFSDWSVSTLCVVTGMH